MGCTTRSSSTWCAPGWNIIFCRAQVCGMRQTFSLIRYQLVRRMRLAQINLLFAARIFSKPTKKPANNGNWSGVSTRLKPDCNGEIFGHSCRFALLGNLIENSSTSYPQMLLAPSAQELYRSRLYPSELN